MKQIVAIFLSSVLFIMVSCNNGTESKQPEAKAADTVAAPPPVAAKPAFEPFKGILIQHKVKNYDKWLPGYLGHDSVRKAYGLTNAFVGRGLMDSNWVIVAAQVNDVSKAKEFAALPSLKEAMKKGGVTGKPTIDFVNVIRNSDSTIESKDRLFIIHHVKDFDAWVKVFDAESPATRASFGMLDRALARGIDDPNMVYILFAVTDMAKAKARGASPELHKLMTDAGVDGPVKQIPFRITNQ